jgi:AraC family transcriptional regulator of arabinose operon
MNDRIYPLISTERNLPLYLVDAGGQENQPYINRSNGFPYYQAIYCKCGKGILKFNGNEYTVSEKMGFIMYPNLVHEYKPLEEPWETHWIAFDGKSLTDLMITLGFDHSGIIFITDTYALDQFLEQILIKSKSKDLLKGYEYSALLYSFLIELKNSASYEQQIQKKFKINQIQIVISYIEKNYNKVLSLKDLSDIINVSPQYLCKLFKACLDIRPFQYLIQQRIRKSKILLLKTKWPIQDIGIKCGFNNVSYFCASFKQLEKITPNDFRKQHG